MNIGEDLLRIDGITDSTVKQLQLVLLRRALASMVWKPQSIQFPMYFVMQKRRALSGLKYHVKTIPQPKGASRSLESGLATCLRAS